MLETFNVMSAFAIICAGKLYFRASQEIRVSQKKLKDLRQSQYYSDKPGKKDPKVDFSGLNNKNQALKVVVEVLAQNIKGLNSKTFSRTFHDLKIGQFAFVQNFNHRFLEGEVGGQFNIYLSGKRVKVDIRQCNIHQHLLVQDKPVKFQIIKDYLPQYQSITIYMRTGCNLVIAGILTYNLQEKQWSIFPSFMMEKLITGAGKQNALSEAFNYLQMKASEWKYIKWLSLFGIGTIVFLRFDLIRNYFTKMYAKFAKLFKKKEDVDFDSITHVIARESDKLRCQCGKTLCVVYQCGHLSSCQICYQNARIKRCRICGETRDKVLRVFT